MSVEDIGRLRKPVVWTLHDMWAFCGTEHLADTGADARWRRGYEHTDPPAGERGLDLDRLVWQRKRAAWRQPFLLVTPSRWLGECAEASALLAGWQHKTIPNALDTSRFAPVDRAAARRALGLAADQPVLLFGGRHSDPNKGYDLLVAVLREFTRLPGGRRAICLGFGETRPPAHDAGGAIRWLGRVSEDARLVSLYSAADVALVTSRLENFPQAATEAQACGCPVAAFSVGGVAETVAHEETGFVAAPFDALALARGVAWLIGDAARHLALRARARERAVRLWSPAVVTGAYLAAYAEAIAGFAER
jgi:glycosyltransferase involved in cell wall biosynthesis